MFKVGDRIRIVTGPWASDCGTIEKMTSRTLRVKVDSKPYGGLALVNPADAELITAGRCGAKSGPPTSPK